MRGTRQSGSTRARGDRGAVLVEFALVTPLLFALLFGIIDFGNMFRIRNAMTNAARDGARWGTTHATAWSTAQPASASSIEGHIQLSGESGNVPNDDGHISISYYDSTTPAPTLCGRFSATDNRFVAAGGYSQSTCVTPGNLIEVKIATTYAGLTPVVSSLFPGGASMTGFATMVIEQ